MINTLSFAFVSWGELEEREMCVCFWVNSVCPWLIFLGEKYWEDKDFSLAVEVEADWNKFGILSIDVEVVDPCIIWLKLFGTISCIDNCAGLYLFP